MLRRCCPAIDAEIFSPFCHAAAVTLFFRLPPLRLSRYAAAYAATRDALRHALLYFSPPLIRWRWHVTNTAQYRHHGVAGAVAFVYALFDAFRHDFIVIDISLITPWPLRHAAIFAVSVFFFATPLLPPRHA